ncbi:MAG: hypothetical protein AB1Z98_08215 [Nannocystaceae bacterium]
MTVMLCVWPAVAVAGSSGAERSESTRDSSAEIPVQRPAGMIGPVQPPPRAAAQPPSIAQPTAATAPSPAATSPAPAATAVSTPKAAPASPDAALAEPSTPPRVPIPHRGAVADLRVGTLGCIGGFCRSGGHDVSPGLRLGGFIGGNVRGWFEAGLGGSWGTMQPNITPGTNALVLYGLDPYVLQQLLAAQSAGLLAVDLAGLAVQDAQLRAAQVGPALRIHLIPRGRVHAFVGSGVGYNLLRARYQTPIGDTRLDFHGINVPVEANVGAYVLPNVALGVQFDYMWTWYGAAVLDHPQQRLALPVSVLQAAGEQQGADFRGQLPQMWSVGLALRGRL